MTSQQPRKLLPAICIFVVDVAAIKVADPEVCDGQAVAHEPSLHHAAFQAVQKLWKH